MSHLLPETYGPIAKFLAAFSILLLRYLVFAGGAFLLFYVLRKESWFHRKIQQRFPDKKRLMYEIRYSLSTFVIFAGMVYFITAAKQAGITQIYTDISEYGWAYFIFSYVLIMVIHDTYFYWTHRMMHHPKLFKVMHKVHHMSHNPSPWAAFSFHPLEAIVEFGIAFIIIFIMPVHPLAIVGFSLSMMAFNVLGHLGFEIFPKGFTKNWGGKLFNSSTHHNMHHKYVRCNYGLYFNIWDRIMGTNHPQYFERFDEVKARPKPVFEEEEPKLQSELATN